MKNVLVCCTLMNLAGASSALGCLNDSELPDREREFRSQYLDSELHLMTVSEKDQTFTDPGQTKTVIGVTLLIGAVGVTVFRRR